MFRKLKYIIVFILFDIFFIFSFSFAWTNVADNSVSILEMIANLLNIIWLPFSIIAGKLLTNQFIYWSNFWIDQILWHIWQFSRTIANYVLWFILILSIFLFLLWKVKNIFSIFWKLALWAILINASWFILASLIDISLVLIAAAWSLPLSLQTETLPKLNYCKEAMISVKNPSLISLKWWWIVEKCESKSDISFKKVYNYLNGISWPLVYIWASILNLDKNWWIQSDKVKNEKSDTKQLMSITDLIHVWVIILFVVPIVLLVIIAVIRLFWLWIYIAFSPILILDYLFWWKYVSWSNKALKLSNAIWLIFQPVLIVFALSVSVIFLLALFATFEGDSTKQDVKTALGICKNDNSSLCINNKPVVSIKWDKVNEIFSEVGWFFGYTIISVMSLIVIWSMLKLAFKSSEITSWIADAWFKFTEEAFKAAPVIPTKYGPIWIWALEKWIGKTLLKSSFDVQASKQAEVLTNKIDQIFWIKWQDISQTDLSTWREKFNSSFNVGQVLFKNYEDFLSSLSWNVTPDIAPRFKELNFEFWHGILGDNKENWDKVFWIKLWKNEHITEDKLFNNTKFRQMLYKLIEDPKLIDTYQQKLLYSWAPNIWSIWNFVDIIANQWSSWNLSMSVNDIRKGKN